MGRAQNESRALDAHGTRARAGEPREASADGFAEVFGAGRGAAFADARERVKAGDVRAGLQVLWDYDGAQAAALTAGLREAIAARLLAEHRAEHDGEHERFFAALGLALSETATPGLLSPQLIAESQELALQRLALSIESIEDEHGAERFLEPLVEISQRRAFFELLSARLAREPLAGLRSLLGAHYQTLHDGLGEDLRHSFGNDRGDWENLLSAAQLRFLDGDGARAVRTSAIRTILVTLEQRLKLSVPEADQQISAHRSAGAACLQRVRAALA